MKMIVSLACVFGFLYVNQTSRKCTQDLYKDRAVEGKKKVPEAHKSPFGGKFDKKLMHRSKKPINSYL